MNLQGISKYYAESKKVPFKYMIPTLAQAQFAKTIGEGVPEKRIFLMTSGNGSGKTTFDWNLLLNIVYENPNIYRDIVDCETGQKYSGFFNYPFFNNYPKNWPRNIWYITNAELLKSAFEEFQNWCPGELYTAHKDGKQYYSRIEFRNTRWSIFFKTVDQDPKTFEGANVGLVFFDEPPPQQLFRAAVFRLRKGGIIVISATPLFGSGWFVDEIKEKMGDGDKADQKVSCWSNCIERAGCWDLGIFGKQKKGNLFENDIKFTLRNVDEDEREAREHGEFKYLVGLVYKTYHKDEHFVELKKPEHPERFMYQFILDPHDRRPPAAMWIRVDKYGRKRVVREWPAIYDPQYNYQPFEKIKSSDPYTVKDFVRFFIQIFKEIGVDPNRVQSIIDPNFGRKPNSTTGRMVYEDYQVEFNNQEYPISFLTNANDHIATGHKKVKDLLVKRSDGDYGLLVSLDCHNTDWSFRNYSYDDWEGKTAEKKGLKEAVKEIGKDFVDLVRYASVVPFTWVDHKLDRMEVEGTDYEEKKRSRIDANRPAGVLGV